MRAFRWAVVGSQLIFASAVMGVLWLPRPAAAQSDYEENHGRYSEAVDRESPLFGLTVRHISGVQLKGAQPGTDARFDVTTLDTGRDWSFAVSPDAAAMVGFHFGLRDFHGTGLDDTFYSVSFGVGLTWFATANLRLSAAFRPGLYTNFGHSLSGEDWQYLGEVMATYRTSPTFFLHLGVGITNDFYDVPAIPLAGFSWVPSSKFRVDVLAPQNAVASWRPAQVVGFHGGVFLTGVEYNWNTATGETKLFAQDVRAEAGMRLYLVRNLSISVTGGGIVAGEYRIAGDQADQENAWFLSLGLGFSF